MNGSTLRPHSPLLLPTYIGKHYNQARGECFCDACFASDIEWLNLETIGVCISRPAKGEGPVCLAVGHGGLHVFGPSIAVCARDMRGYLEHPETAPWFQPSATGADKEEN